VLTFAISGARGSATVPYASVGAVHCLCLQHVLQVVGLCLQQVLQVVGHVSGYGTHTSGMSTVSLALSGVHQCNSLFVPLPGLHSHAFLFWHGRNVEAESGQCIAQVCTWQGHMPCLHDVCSSMCDFRKLLVHATARNGMAALAAVVLNAA
jgi:hypothetical protein